MSGFLTCFLFYQKEKSPTSSPQLKKQKAETAPKDTLEKINVVIPIVLPGALRHPGTVKTEAPVAGFIKFVSFESQHSYFLFYVLKFHVRCHPGKFTQLK